MTTPFEETAIARRYEPIRELGSGGMGTVYLVADRFRGGEQVALKTIHPERLRHLDKFRQEFTVLSKLRHPHLLRVIDFGSTPAPEERFFFTSEYVAGQRLDTWAAGKGLVPLLQVLTQLTEVLHHLHARNVLHLDIKPDNLLVTGGNGEPVSSRLIDLGLARFRQQQDQETSGTVHFMSPEQITRGELDGRTDCWAVGVMLYFCLYERYPFAGDTIPQIFDRILHLNAEFPARDDVPDRVVALIEQLLQKDPRKRISGSTGLLRSLTTILGDLDDSQRLPDLQPPLFNREHFSGRRDPFARLVSALPGPGRPDETSVTDARGWAKETEPPLAVIVTGAEGIGKTRLLEEIKSYAQLRGIEVFGGQHLASCRGQLRQVLREIALLREQTQGLSDDQRALIKSLGSNSGQEAQVVVEDAWLNHELAHLMLVLAESRPFVIWLDEPLAEDDETRTQLVFLVRHLVNHLVRAEQTRSPLTVAISVRDAASWNESLSGLGGDFALSGPRDDREWVATLELAAWTAAQTHRYVEAALPELEIPQEFSRALQRASAGNPGMLREICTALVRQQKLRVGMPADPQLISKLELEGSALDRAKRRWEQLGNDARRAMLLVALCPIAVRRSELASLSNSTEEQLELALAELLDWGLIDSDGSEYRIASPILRQLAAGLHDAKDLATTRASLAGELASGLAQRSDDPRAVFQHEAIAQLFADAGDLEAAHPHARIAGRALQELHQVERAITQLEIVCAAHDQPEIAIQLANLLNRVGRSEQALETLERHGEQAEVLLAKGQIHQKNGDYERAIACFEHVLAATADGDVSDLAAQAQIALAETKVYQGEYDRALSHCASGAALLSAEASPALIGALHHKRGLAHYFRGESDAARRELGEALTLLQGEQGATLQPSILNALGLLEHEAERLREALALYEQAHAAAHRVGQLQREITISMNIGTVMTELEQFDRALDELQRCLARAEDIDNSWEVAKIANNLALLFRLFGHRERALRFARVSLAIAEEKDIPPLRAYNHSVLIDIAMDHGDVELARTHLHRLLQQTEASSDRYIRIDRMLAQAKAALTEANYGAAVEALRGLEGEEREGIEPLVLIGGALQAHALAEMRRYDESASQLDELLPIAQRLGRLEHLWFVHYLSGRCREASSGGLAATEAYKAARAALVELRDRVPEEFRVHFFKPLLRHDAWERLERATPRTQSFHGEEEIEGAFLNYRQFKRFMEINSRLNIERNSEKLLELILDTVIDLTGAERGFLIVRDNGKIRVPVARNIDQETIKRQQFKISRSIAEKVLESGEPLLSVDAQSDARLEDFSSVHELRLRSILCFPLRIKSDVKGAIYIDNRFQYRAFNDRDLMVLSAFGDQAGIAIHNAELMEANLTKQKQLEEAMRQVEELNKKLAETVELKSQRLDEITTILSSHAQTIREAHSFHNIISKNAKMQEVFRIVTRVAELDIPVYIYGESGTGKELVAKAIHFAGNRPLDKFISVNCGSIPENLLESELFGHVKGSFTGAYYDKQGLFSLANNGTLFLDEIGDMPLNMQVKLLRVLQDKRFRQVGGTRELSTNARIISASNKNLLQLVNDGTFRQDLFFRLNVVQIDLPALRERREDIPLLVETFMKRECGARSKAIARDALRALTIHDWPGNVRELENEVSRAVALSGETIALADLSPTLLRETKGRTRVSASAPDGDLKQTVQTLERDMLVKTLRETRGSVTKTAKQLGLSRMGVYKKMAKFGLSREMFRS